MKPNDRPKLPDGYSSWLHWAIANVANPNLYHLEKMRAKEQLADLRRDADKWREHEATQKASGISAHHATTPAGDPLTYYRQEPDDA